MPTAACRAAPPPAVSEYANRYGKQVGPLMLQSVSELCGADFLDTETSVYALKEFSATSTASRATKKTSAREVDVCVGVDWAMYCSGVQQN